MITIAAISGATIGWAIVWLLVAAACYWVLKWGINEVNPPQPFRKVIDVLLVIAVVAFLLNAILTLVGHPFIAF